MKDDSRIVTTARGTRVLLPEFDEDGPAPVTQ